MTREEIEFFNTNGYAGPYKMCEPDEMAAIRARVDAEVLAIKPQTHDCVEQCRHLDCRVAYELCSHPAIVERMACVMGPDLILWRSNFFQKNPGDREIPWHQDGGYWPITPAINISAWLAVDESTVENSCVQIIPGSHNMEIPMVQSPPGMQFSRMSDPKFVDVSKKIDMPMKPGEFILFNEKTLHHSEPNRSNKRRLGLAVRVTLPSVKVDHTRLIPGHAVVQLCGEDRHKLNLTTQPPV
jgi:ectoine hydroxylase-related dioxygenase (phytanoyl-CoA dioxygenase family)